MMTMTLMMIMTMIAIIAIAMTMIAMTMIAIAIATTTKILATKIVIVKPTILVKRTVKTEMWLIYPMVGFKLRSLELDKFTTLIVHLEKQAGKDRWRKWKNEIRVYLARLTTKIAKTHHPGMIMTKILITG